MNMGVITGRLKTLGVENSDGTIGIAMADKIILTGVFPVQLPMDLLQASIVQVRGDELCLVACNTIDECEYCQSECNLINCKYNLYSYCNKQFRDVAPQKLFR